MIVYIALPLSLLLGRRVALEPNDPSLLGYENSWWNRSSVLYFAYAIWLVTPVSFIILGGFKFVRDEYPARAVFSDVREFLEIYALMPVAWEFLLSGATGIFLLQLFVHKTHGFNALRAWCIQHATLTFTISSLMVFLGQLVLINLSVTF